MAIPEAEKPQSSSSRALFACSKVERHCSCQSQNSRRRYGCVVVGRGWPQTILKITPSVLLHGGGRTPIFGAVELDGVDLRNATRPWEVNANTLKKSKLCQRAIAVERAKMPCWPVLVEVNGKRSKFDQNQHTKLQLGKCDSVGSPSS